MRQRLFMGFAAAAALVLALHAAAPAAQAEGASINATCTVYANPAYRSGSNVIGVHSVRCTGVVVFINMSATLTGPNGSNAYQYKSGNCSYKSECFLYTSQPYVPGYWTTLTTGNTTVSPYAQTRTLNPLCC